MAFTQAKLVLPPGVLPVFARSVADDFYNSLAEPVLAELERSGTVRLSMRNENCAGHVVKSGRNTSGCFPDGGGRVHAYSSDFGATFGAPSKKDVLPGGSKTTVLPDPTTTLGCQAALLRVGADLYFSNPDDKESRVSLTVRRSTSWGSTSPGR